MRHTERQEQNSARKLLGFYGESHKIVTEWNTYNSPKKLRARATKKKNTGLSVGFPAESFRPYTNENVRSNYNKYAAVRRG